MYVILQITDKSIAGKVRSKLRPETILGSTLKTLVSTVVVRQAAWIFPAVLSRGAEHRQIWVCDQTVTKVP